MESNEERAATDASIDLCWKKSRWICYCAGKRNGSDPRARSERGDHVMYPSHISEILTPDKDLVQKIVKLGARKLLVLTGRTQTEGILHKRNSEL